LAKYGGLGLNFFLNKPGRRAADYIKKEMNPDWVIQQKYNKATCLAAKATKS
jgi:hypothetical protein